MVADQPTAETVIDQPGVAVGTCEPKPALAAQRERRIAATIEEQKRLLAAGQRSLHRLGEPRRDEAAARRTFGPQVDRLDGGKVLVAEPLGQMHAGVAAASGVDLGLDRRCRRYQHDRDVRSARAHHRHVAGMVARAVFLLVGGVVLLIDHDQPEIAVRQKQRRAGADDDAHLARGDRAPGARAQARRQLRVPLGRAHAEALGETVEELRGQGDLGHEHQRLPSATDDLADGLEINLRLAGAGDAVEQGDAIAALGHGCMQGIRRLALRRGEVRRRKIRVGRARHRLGRQHQAFQGPLIDQAVDDSGRDARPFGDIALGAREAVGEQREHAVARGGHPLRRGTGEAHADALARGPQMLAHAQRHTQHRAAGSERVAGDPVDELAQFRLERRQLELLLHVLHAVVEAGIGAGVLRPDHPGRHARPERNAHEVAGRQRELFRHPVGIGLIEGDREQDIDNASGHRRSGRLQAFKKE